MHLSELLQSLEDGGFPVAFNEWPKENLPQLPYCVYRTPGVSPIYADGALFFSLQRIQLIAYAAIKSPEIEQKLQNILRDVPCSWTEEPDSEGRYRYNIELEVIDNG